MDVKKLYSQFSKIKKKDLINMILAYELYRNSGETNYPVTFLGFLSKEYPLKWKAETEIAKTKDS